MIITSNSVQHEYTIPGVTIVGDVDGFENVAERVKIYLHSSTTFDHTYETTLYDMNVDPRVGIATTVTESKTITEFTYYDVDLNTVGLAATTFSAFDDLEEDEVVQWCIDADTDRIEGIQDEQEAKVLEAKDKILNPRKYYRGDPVTPWRRRADEAAVENL
jgi:hypothetical protein